jgi:hypothetical protein
MNISVCLLVTLVALSLFSCDSETENDRDQGRAFYDVAGFIHDQSIQLNEIKPTVVKTTRMGDESNKLSATEIDWQKELELFSQADLNKPAYRQSYLVSRPDSSTYQYTSKEGDRLSVRSLRIVVDSTNMPLYIKAVMKAENKLYTSEKIIEMHCRRVKNLLRINSYRVEGFQKLAMMDKKPFLIEGLVSY